MARTEEYRTGWKGSRQSGHVLRVGARKRGVERLLGGRRGAAGAKGFMRRWVSLWRVAFVLRLGRGAFRGELRAQRPGRTSSITRSPSWAL